MLDLQCMGEPEYRRQFVVNVLERCEIAPAPVRGRPRVDVAERVRITYRTPEPAEPALYLAHVGEGGEVTALLD
jgi:hypothetical protein